jgi:hypothetical protein
MLKKALGTDPEKELSDKSKYCNLNRSDSDLNGNFPVRLFLLKSTTTKTKA